MQKSNTLILGIAPARRFWFSGEAVDKNRDRIVAETKRLCKENDVKCLDIEGLSSDAMLADHETAEKAIERFRQAGVNALFFPHCNFGQEEDVLRVARALQVPVLLWGPRDGAPNGLEARDTDTQCGLFASGKALYRGGIPFTYIENVPLESDIFKEGFCQFLKTARIVNALKTARVAQISVRPEPFLTVMINESELFERFGVEVVPVPATVILKEAKSQANTKEAEEILQGYRNAGVDTEGMSDETLRNMAGLELAIWQFAKENDCNAVVSECWNIYGDALGIRPCAVFGNLLERGLPVACENDVHGALSLLMAQACAIGDEAVFLADLTQRHPTNDNAELLWHCGPFPKSLRKSGEHAFLKDGMGNWPLKDGALTMLRFDGCRGSYSLLAGDAHSTEGPITNGNYIWAEVEDWPRWEKKLVCGPYIHHVACVYGHHSKALEEACRYVSGLSFDAP